LRNNSNSLIDNIRKINPLEYIAIWEPHKSGYAHIHILFFGAFTLGQKSRIRSLWVDKYQSGSSAAIQFDVKYKGRLTSARNYVMKYVGKTLTSSFDDENINIFNTVVWFCSQNKTDEVGIRTFQPSRLLSKIMSGEKLILNSDIDWYRVEFYCCGTVKVLKGDPANFYNDDLDLQTTC